MAKAVVVAYEQQAHAQPLFQHLLHKLLCREGRHLGREVQHLDMINAQTLQQPHLILSGGEQLRHIVGLQHLSGVQVECYHHALQSPGLCQALHLVNEVLMSAVHTIKKPMVAAVRNL